MNRMVRTLAALAALFWLSAGLSVAMAKEWAPLPEGVIASGNWPVKGLYAEENRYGNYDEVDKLKAFDADCEQRKLEPKVEGRDTIYGNVKRLYRADGRTAFYEFVNRFEGDPQTCTGRVSGKVRYSEKSEFSETALPECSRWRGCTDRTVAGIEAKCVDLGDGFQGSLICVSKQNDASKGLWLSSQRYDDVGGNDDEDFKWEIARVDPKALIDPVVFTPPKF